MPDDGNFAIHLRQGRSNFSGNICSMAFFITFGYNNDERSFKAFPAVLQRIDHAFDGSSSFRDHHDLGAAANGAGHGNITRIAAHYFNKKYPFVAVSSVPDLIDGIQSGVYRSIVANGIIGAVQVVIDGSGGADKRDPEFFGKNISAGKRAVAANRYYAFNAVFL